MYEQRCTPCKLKFINYTNYCNEERNDIVRAVYITYGPIISDMGESQHFATLISCYILKICPFTIFSFIRSYESEIDHVHIL